MTSAQGRRLGLFMYGLTGGGVARRMVTLANSFAERGDKVDLLLARAGNVAGIEIDERVNVVGLGNWRTSLPWVRRKRRRQFAQICKPLAAYLKRHELDALISADNLANLTVLGARQRAGLSLPLIMTQRTHTSTFMTSKINSDNRQKLMDRIKRLYPLADAIVGVSEGVSANLVEIGLPSSAVRTIYNPVIGPDTAALAAQPVDHPWFGSNQTPVILGVGRITPQKDYPTRSRRSPVLSLAGET